MRIQSTIQSVVDEDYWNIVELSLTFDCNIVTLMNPSNMPVQKGDSLDADLFINLVTSIRTVPNKTTHFIRQKGAKNGTNVCGEISSIIDSSTFMVSVDEVGAFRTELEFDYPLDVGDTVEFFGELQAEI